MFCRLGVYCSWKLENNTLECLSAVHIRDKETDDLTINSSYLPPCLALLYENRKTCRQCAKFEQSSCSPDKALVRPLLRAPLHFPDTTVSPSSHSLPTRYIVFNLLLYSAEVWLQIINTWATQLCTCSSWTHIHITK